MSKNTSDSIEEYIKQLLAQTEIAELKRSEVADIFQVVPSQINYVIKTRFTESRGYVVESKRGGGGYIRIGKVQFSDQHQLLEKLLVSIGEQISQTVYADILDLLTEHHLLEGREAIHLWAVAQDSVLGVQAARIRARMLEQLLRQLDRKGNG